MHLLHPIGMVETRQRVERRLLGSEGSYEDLS